MHGFDADKHPCLQSVRLSCTVRRNYNNIFHPDNTKTAAHIIKGTAINQEIGHLFDQTVGVGVLCRYNNKNKRFFSAGKEAVHFSVSVCHSVQINVAFRRLQGKGGTNES